jgi:hypothetical protein
MQRPWWLPVRDFTRHMLVYSGLLALFFVSTLFGAALSSLAGRVLVSKFSLQIWIFLEYAVVVCDALTILAFMTVDVFRSIRRQMQ